MRYTPLRLLESPGVENKGSAGRPPKRAGPPPTFVCSSIFHLSFVFSSVPRIEWHYLEAMEIWETSKFGLSLLSLWKPYLVFWGMCFSLGRPPYTCSHQKFHSKIPHLSLYGWSLFLCVWIRSSCQTQILLTFSSQVSGLHLLAPFLYH